ERMISAISECHNRNMSGFGIAMNDPWQVKSIHLAQVGCTENRRRGIPFQHGQRICGLRAVRYFHSFLFQGLGQTLGEENVAIDYEHLGRNLRTHARTSTDIRRSRSSTSTISSFNDSNPDTYGGNLPLAGRRSAMASSHSPV